ncbi:MAG: patatin [Planctomycetes bacterium]|nr:patatin [Planctomycetota bacterium]
MNGSKLALVMGGGGARAAYQAGVLRAIARRFPNLQLPILTGVSAGAINTAFLASREGSFGERVLDLEDLWRGLSTERVLRSDALTLFKSAARWMLRLSTGSSSLAPHPRALVDTQPLRELLTEALRADSLALPGIARNLRADLEAVAITTTDYANGASITHVQSRAPCGWSRPSRVGVRAELSVEHIMASAALPLFFPAVQLGASWHGDGGVGLTAPLAPAVHLGANRILAISTRYERSSRDPLPPPTGYPPPAQVIGLLMNAIFLDMLDQDALNLERVNELIAALPEDRRRGLHPVRLLMLRPSRNIAALAAAHESRLPQPYRFLMRGTGTKETRTPESLSMVLFERPYTSELVAMGEEDTEKRMGEIAAFLEGEDRSALQFTGFWRV